MFLSTVIPNYNGEELLKRNLPQVIKALEQYKNKTKNNYEVIVVDDYSTDNSMDVLRKFTKEFDNFKYLLNNKNYGFSTSVNRGAKEATGKFLLLLNSDVSPGMNFIEPLIKNFNNEKVFAVGCLDESVENGEILKRGKGKGAWRRGFLVHSAAEIKKGPTLWVSGGSGLFRRDTWNKLGGLREIYNPFYWEDIDLSYRAMKSGYLVLFEPDSVVVHEHEKGSIKSKYSNSQINKIAYKNQIIFVWLNADINNLIKNILWTPYHFLKTILRGDLMFTLAFLKALWLVPKIINERKLAKLFVKTDDEVVSIAK